MVFRAPFTALGRPTAGRAPGGMLGAGELALASLCVWLCEHAWLSLSAPWLLHAVVAAGAPTEPGWAFSMFLERAGTFLSRRSLPQDPPEFPGLPHPGRLPSSLRHGLGEPMGTWQ